MPTIAELGKNTRFKSGERAVEAGRKGGIKSQQLAREKRTMRKELEILLDEEITRTVNGKKQEMTVQEAGLRALIKRYLKGDPKVMELIRDTIGQKPVDVVAVSEIDPSVIDEIESIVNDQDSSCKLSEE